MKKETRYLLVLILFLVVLASVVLYRDRSSAANLEVVPDSSEYALAAHRFVTTGEYRILVDGRWLPPRYPPWFSLFALAPAYLLLGPALGNAILPVTLFAIAGVGISFFLGKRIGGSWGGLIAGLALLVLPDYRLLSKFVMTDVPASVLLLAACLLYVQLRSVPRARPRRYLLPGAVIAVAALFRSACAAAVIPFLLYAISSRSWTRALRSLIFLCAPLAAAAAASMTYNATTFGSPFRTGYHFWAPVPYDYTDLTLSLSYVPINFAVLWGTGALVLLSIALAMWALARWRSQVSEHARVRLQPVRWVAEFTILGVGPIVAFHLLYFYPTPRFYLPLSVLSIVMIGGLAGALLRRTLPRLAVVEILVVALLWVVFLQPSELEATSPRRQAVGEILQHTPQDAWIISGIDSAYLEYLVAEGSQRRIVPISRNVEYADKVIAPLKIPQFDPPPSSWRDHRSLGLLRAGAEEAVQFVAAEHLDFLTEQNAQGARLFLDMVDVQPEDEQVVAELRKRFFFIPVTDTLLELHNRD